MFLRPNFSREHLFRLSALACLLAFHPPALPCHAQVAEAARPSAPTYRISGKVVDARSGAALARCVVQIAAVRAPGTAHTMVSGEDGGFAFAGLPRGKYSLGAERRGYLPQSYEQHEEYSTAIAVGPGLASENLIFRLTAESVLTGTVTDIAGEPVRAALVRLFQNEDVNGIRMTRARQTTATDDLGVYEMPGLRPGAYFVVVTAHPWYAQRPQRGAGVPSSQFRALDVAYPNTIYAGVTDEDAATPIPVRGGERLVADITLVAEPALRLHLTEPPTAPNEHWMVSLTQSIFGQVENVPATVNYAPGGAVELDGVVPGHYEVSVARFVSGSQGPGSQGSGSQAFGPQGFGPQQRPAMKHFDAVINSGSTELSSAGSVEEITVTGNVTAAADKLPAGGVIVLARRPGQAKYYGRLDDAGKFSIAVQPASYEVILGINGMYVESIKAAGAAMAGRSLTVKAGDSPQITVVAASGYGEIEGTALVRGKPASTVMVLLAPEKPENSLFRRDQSDSDGTFTIPSIVPGRYRMLAVERGWELEWAKPEVLGAYLEKSVPVVVRAGDHLKQSVNVQPR